MITKQITYSGRNPPKFHHHFPPRMAMRFAMTHMAISLGPQPVTADRPFAPGSELGVRTRLLHGVPWSR